MLRLLFPACLAVPVAFSLTAPAAAETFLPQAGCTLVVTIQSDACYVRNVVICPEMGDGPLVYGTDKAGKVVATAFDADGATLFTGAEGAGMMLQDRTDLFSLSALTDAGTDSYDYTLAGRDGAEVRFAGTARLTGETVEIDGRSLLVIATEQVATPAGGEGIATEITSYLDRDLSLVLTAFSRDPATGNVFLQRAPVDFLFPGEDGALAADPRIACEG